MVALGFRALGFLGCRRSWVVKLGVWFLRWSAGWNLKPSSCHLCDCLKGSRGSKPNEHDGFEHALRANDILRKQNYQLGIGHEIIYWDC